MSEKLEVNNVAWHGCIIFHCGKPYSGPEGACGKCLAHNQVVSVHSDYAPPLQYLRSEAGYYMQQWS